MEQITDMQIAFVTMGPGAAPLDAESLSRAWSRLWPNEEPLADLQGDRGALTFSFMGGGGMLGFMPAPVPWSDLEGPAACAWHWREATEVLRAHEAHLVVGVMGGDEGPSLADSIRLTLLIAAVCEASPATTGVYWGEGTAVSPADRFVELAREMAPDDYPLLAWVEFRVFPADEGTRWSVFTTGLRALGFMEIEVRAVKGDPSDILETVLDIAGYVVHSNAVLKDGDTIGTSAEQKLRIRHVPSEWEREGPVVWIDM
ncbi:MAG: DUF4261 domain-containing protein [Myxococcales bacterium]|nr:DUF4261 domain-containing protein [Myxococcales bacterium]